MRLSEKIQNGSTSQFLNNLNEAQNLKKERKYRNPNSDPKAGDKFVHIEHKEPDWKSFVKEMAKDYWDAGQSFSSDDIDEFKGIMKDSNFNLSDEELETAWNYYWECYYEYLDEYNNVKESEETNVNESEAKYKVGDIVKVPYKYGVYTPGEFTEAPIINIDSHDFITVEIPSKLTVTMEQVEKWNNLEECDKKLDEKYVESFGGDTKDFIDEVNVIKAKLEEIDTDSFAAKLSQQVVEDWIETCDRLLERANRLDSGDEFGTKE